MQLIPYKTKIKLSVCFTTNVNNSKNGLRSFQFFYLTSAHRTFRSAKSSTPTMSNCTLPSSAAHSPSPLPIRTHFHPAARTPPSRRSTTLPSIIPPKPTRNRGTRLQIHGPAHRQHVFAPQIPRDPQQLLLPLIEHHFPRGSRQIRPARIWRQHDFHGYSLHQHGVSLRFPPFPRFAPERYVQRPPDPRFPAGPRQIRAAIEVQRGVVHVSHAVGGQLGVIPAERVHRRVRRAERTGASGRSEAARGRRSDGRGARRWR